MWREGSALKLFTTFPVLRMPAVFFVGRRDHRVPPDTTVAYVDTLEAPSKQLLWFDQSGHEPFVDEPAAFNRAVIDMVERSPHRRLSAPTHSCAETAPTHRQPSGDRDPQNNLGTNPAPAQHHWPSARRM
ncbi:alpha/beta fold hydrolase [Mycobacterium sp. ZZG]